MCFRSAVFSPFWSFFAFLGGTFPVFALPPLFFLPLFSSGGVNICDFGVSFLLFCCQRLLFMDKRCFFLIFYGKRRKRAKKQAKFRRIHALFCVFFVFSRFFGLFSWCFLLVFFGFLRRNCAIERISAPFSLFFGGIIAFFICSFSSLAFAFLESNKNGYF